MISKYDGQPITTGMIICRRSVMHNGIATRPLRVKRVSGTRIHVVDARDEGTSLEQEKVVLVKTVAFIADTLDEGLALYQASINFMASEQRHYATYASERDERLRSATAAAIAEANGEST